MEVFSFYICRMNNILTDIETGNQYMIQPSVQELEDGIIQYVPELHAHLWDYILCDGQLYSNHPDLVDWDQGVEEADDDDDDVDLVSEDEGYDTEDDDDFEVDQWNFGIAPMLWHIQL